MAVAGAKPSEQPAAPQDIRNYDEGARQRAIARGCLQQMSTWFCCAFSTESADLLAAGSSTGNIRVYSVSELSRRKASTQHRIELSAHQGPCYALSMVVVGGNPLLLSCGDDSTVCGWKWEDLMSAADTSTTHTVEPVLKLTLPSDGAVRNAEINALAVDVDRGHVYAGAGDGTCYGWDISTGSAVQALRGHEAGLLSVDLMRSQMATGSMDGTCRVWDIRAGQCQTVVRPDPPSNRKLRPGSCMPVRCAKFDGGGNWLAVGTGPSVQLWSLCAMKAGVSIQYDAIPQAMVTEPNRILVAGDEPCVRRYDFSGKPLATIRAASDCTYGLACHPTSRVIATAGAHGKLDVYTEHGSHLGGI